MEDNFAFIIHPIDPQRDVARKFPTLGKLPRWLIEFLSVFFPPVYISQITGIESAHNGRSLHGWFVACPLTPSMMMRLPTAVSYHKITQTGRLAERLGARILGLGAFTSVVGDGGITIAQRLNIPVTNGDSYTVATAVRAIQEAAAIMEIPLPHVTAAVVGATGAIGSVCAQMLAPQVKQMILIGRNQEKLQKVAQTLPTSHVTLATDMSALLQADLIITVTSAVDTIIEPQHLRSGAIVCDVSRPRDVSRQVAEQRPDILVIEGGMVKVPGNVDFHFNFGFPLQMAYACMAETMTLALEQQYESYTVGKEIELSQVVTIDKIAAKHGFKLGGFRSFEQAVTEADIANVKACRQPTQLNGQLTFNQPFTNPLSII